MMLPNPTEPNLDNLLHDMTSEFVRRARSAGATRQQLIDALSTRLIILGYEETGSPQAIAEWLRQVAASVERGNINSLLAFAKKTNTCSDDVH